MKKTILNLTRMQLYMLYSLCATISFPASISSVHAKQYDREILSSIGSLVQRSQVVVRGTIGEPIKPWNDEDIKSIPWNIYIDGVTVIYMDGVTVTFQPAQIIIGNQSVARDISRVAFVNRKDVPHEGEEVILFLTRKWIDPYLVYHSFDRVDEFDDYKLLDEWVVVGGRRGMLKDGEVILDDIARIIRQYDVHLRKPIDIKQYVYFLAGMHEHPIDRVRIDAWWYDWLRSGRTEERQQAWQEILEADDLPEAITRRMERSRAHSAAALRTRSREEVEAAFEEYEWWDAIRSDDKDRIQQAFRFLGKYASHELELYQDLWRADMMELLMSQDDDLRVWAASELVRIGEQAAIPVLIEALRSDRRLRRSASSIELRRFTEQDFPLILMLRKKIGNQW